MDKATHYHPVTGMLYWLEKGSWVFETKYTTFCGHKYTRVNTSGMRQGFLPLGLKPTATSPLCKYWVELVHHPKTQYRILGQEIWARDFEDAHTFAMAWCTQMKPLYPHDLFYNIEGLS